MRTQRYIPEPWSPQATRPTHRNPEADEALRMERGEQTIFFACLHQTLLQSDCVYYFSKREQEALVHRHILSSFKNGGRDGGGERKKKIIFQISETHTQRHTPHLHPKQLLKLFYTAAAPLGEELQPLPQQGISSPIWARSLCFLPRSLTRQPESLSQPATACPHRKAATSRSSWWQSRQRHMVAGMGPRRAQSSPASDVWEHKGFFMKK